MSMISEQVKRLREKAKLFSESGFAFDGIVKDYNDAADIIEELSKKLAVGKGGWIPCSEKLPEDDIKEYIVQKTSGFIHILGFTKDAYKLSRYDFPDYKGNKKPIFYDWDSEYGYCEWECVAWMPLPEPYKGE